MARPGLYPKRLYLPRRRTLFRCSLVAALLTLAVGVLYAAPAPAACPTDMATPHRTSAGPEFPTAPPDATPEPDSTHQPHAAAVPAGLAGVAVRLADPAIVAVLRPGTRVDLHGDTPVHTVTDAMVLSALPGDSFDEPGAAALFVAVPPPAAAHLSNLPVGVVFRIIVRSP